MTIRELGPLVRPVNLSSPLQAAGRSTSSPATPADTTIAQPSSVPPPSSDQVQQAVKEVTAVTQAKASSLQFSIDEETGTTVVKIVDTETHNVIRQIPAEEILAIARSLDKMAGLLLKQKA